MIWLVYGNLLGELTGYEFILMEALADIVSIVTILGHSWFQKYFWHATWWVQRWDKGMIIQLLWDPVFLKEKQ